MRCIRKLAVMKSSNSAPEKKKPNTPNISSVTCSFGRLNKNQSYCLKKQVYTSLRIRENRTQNHACIKLQTYN